MLKAIYFALHFAMLILGLVISIHIDLWIGLAIAITFGVKFFFMLPNNKEGFYSEPAELDRINNKLNPGENDVIIVLFYVISV